MRGHLTLRLALNAVRVCNNYDNDRLFGTPASFKGKHHCLTNCQDTYYLRGTSGGARNLDLDGLGPTEF